MFFLLLLQSQKQTWPVRLGVRTLDFHSRNRGSIPLRATKNDCKYAVIFFCVFSEMISVYALANPFNSEIYIGISKDILARLKQHNSGKNRYTKAFIPWKIIYYLICYRTFPLLNDAVE